MFSKLKRWSVDNFYYIALRAVIKAAQKKKYKSRLSLIKKIKKESGLWPLRAELIQLMDCVERVSKISGDIAEVGVFEGGTGKLISELKGDKPLHLFDTFEGLPDQVEDFETKLFSEGQFAPRKSLKQLRNEFNRYPHVNLYKGIFPKETGHHVENKKFSFVHLDVDLYSSTLDSLQFFYPRLSKGGIILSHDYLIGEGVRKAFDEYFSDRSEPVIPVAGCQCLVVKCG